MELSSKATLFQIDINSERLANPDGVIEFVRALKIKYQICLAWLFSDIRLEERQRLIDFVNKSSVRSLIPPEF